MAQAPGSRILPQWRGAAIGTMTYPGPREMTTRPCRLGAAEPGVIVKINSAVSDFPIPAG